MCRGVLVSVLMMRGCCVKGDCVPFGVAGYSEINCEHLQYYRVPSLVLWGTGEMSPLWGYVTERTNDMGQQC